MHRVWQVAGRSVRADMDGVRRLTGYCPQFDALVPLLSVREHLDLYSSLRGVPRHQRPAVSPAPSPVANPLIDLHS